MKKRQIGICTVDYYDLATDWFCLYDWGGSKIEAATKELNCSEEEIYTLIEKKLEPIQEQIIAEFQQTEEYKTHEEHEKITTLHAARKVEFNAKYNLSGNEYDKCYDVLRNGLIERNPVKLAELPRQTERQTRQAMTREQQALFMEYAKESYLYHFFEVMLRTGMRKGEMQGLKYSDVDKKENVIHVQRTLKYIEGQGYIEDTPKTRTSARDIPLTAAIVKHIEEQRKFWGFKVVKMDQYLFCNENGAPISRERVQAEIDRTIKRIREAGYDFPRITSHVFRHTFATRAIEAGMQPQVLKTILGHSSLAMTMDLYSHVLPDTKAEEMEKIANVF